MFDAYVSVIASILNFVRFITRSALIVNSLMFVAMLPTFPYYLWVFGLFGFVKWWRDFSNTARSVSEYMNRKGEE